ncbi:MAG: S8 family serine peptidase, partial [Thermonemataceae bacterium]|nr:S8 family serine peptidase [Thermonemataceae bacterium]
MKISYIPLLLFYFLFFTKIYAQNEQERQRIMATYNQEGLKKLSEFFRLQEFEEKKKAYAMAKKKGWQIFLTAKDGTISELQKLDIWGNPIYYSTQSNLNAAITTRANKLWTGGSLGLNLNGQGMIVGEWDGGPILSTHQEFGSRVTQRDGVAFTTANGNNEHATHVAGTLIASGVDANAKGMAHQADLWANEWNTDETEMTNQAALGLLISNHSYGYNSSFLSQYQFGFYDATARDWDLIANNAPYYLIVKAAGNDRGAGYNTGGVFGTTGYNLISGSATAKNNLVVAAVNDVISYTGPSSVTMSSFSSWGPTDDGRIKPDISGNGVGVYSCSSYGTTNYTTMSGTSMASPNVTGTLTLLQQHYKNLNGGTFMKSATLRALAIHTADEAGANPGPDYAFGWGLLNAETAVNLITNKGNTTIIDERTLNNTSTYTLNVEASASPLEVTICWNDPAGTPLGGTPLNDTSPMLVNDLDVRVSDGVTTYLPWRLDPANPSNAATQADNTVDNVEKIVISSPTPGATYTITVSHKGTLAASQEYSLIVSTIANTGDPIVEFVSATSNTTESSTSGTEDCRGYQDVNIPLKISKVPSSDVTVDFTLSGTAANNADYKLNSSTVTFPAGSAANQSLSLRVYDEQGIESLEDIIITINSVSVGATIGTSNTHTASITDNDAAPLAANAGGTLLSEDFEGAVAGWAELTAVAGNNNWRIGNQRVLNGANSAYVSSGAATGNYDINSASDRVLRSSLIDATAYPTNDLQVSFNFQCNGERSSGTNWDYGRLGYFTEAAPTTWIAIEGSAASSPYQGVTTTTARTVA